MKAQYSISDLETLSGIRAHTIRIWEQRYDLFHPSRTETNIRYYSDSDLKKLLNISTLQRYGWKISKLGSLTQEELNLELKKHISSNVLKDDFILDSVNELLISLVAMDEQAFSSVFQMCREKLGFERTIEKVIFPVMIKIGLLWNTSEIIPAQEHFISSLVKMKIAAATDALQFDSVKGEKIILYTPENEMHDIGLMLVNYLLRSKGHSTIYLGQSVPFDNLEPAAGITGANSLFFAMTIISDKEKFSQYLHKISGLTTIANKYFLADPESMKGVRIPESITWIKNPATLEKYIIGGVHEEIHD